LFSPDYFWRYSRQIVLHDVGVEGQEKLKDGSVAIIGLGGLGSQVAMSLAASGVGHMRLVDFDVVSTPDLHRQLIYSERDVGYAKAEAAANRISNINRDVRVEPRCEYVSEENARDLVGDVDLVIDCTDSFQAKYTINRVCAKLKKPLIFGSAIEYYGNVATFEPWGDVCLECLYPELSDEDYPSCAVAGVLPQCVQVVGSIQSAEAVRYILGSPTLLNTLLFVDLKNYALDRLNIAQNPSCPHRANKPLSTPRVWEPTEVCSRNGRRQLLMVLESKPNVDEVYERWVRLGDAERRGRLAVEVRKPDGVYTYTAAGAILGEVDTRIDAKTAKQIITQLATTASQT
jgi:Dinucleotide-utilizing enzymes involved in molybdopterin and thiamine biosynthesis family 2